MARWLNARLLPLLVFPAALAAVLAGPPMIGTAEGCSGGPNDLTAGWHYIYGWDDLTAPPDAVVILRGTLRDISSADALAGITVTVTDPSNQAIDGTTAIEELSGAGYSGSRDVAVIWKPQSALVADTTYVVSWKTDPAATANWAGTITSQAALQTVSTSASALPPSCTAKPMEVPRLVGNLVSCEDTSLCPPDLITFGTTEVELAAMSLDCSYASTSTSVYQLTRVEPVSGKGTLHDPPQALLRQEAIQADQWLFLTFADELAEYCVRLVTRDLRNGAETTSPEICVPRVDLPSPSTSLLGQTLAFCAAPPSDELKDEWCALNSGSPLCKPVPPDGGGSAGSAGSGTQPPAADGSGGASQVSNASDAAGGGCTASTRGDRRGLGALVVALVVLARRRRSR